MTDYRESDLSCARDSSVGERGWVRSDGERLGWMSSACMWPRGGEIGGESRDRQMRGRDFSFAFWKDSYLFFSLFFFFTEMEVLCCREFQEYVHLNAGNKINMVEWGDKRKR